MIIPLDGGLFDVFINLDNLKLAEVKAIKRGKMRYGIFSHANIPFLVLDFPDVQLQLDAPFNIHKIKSEIDVDKWLQTEANLVNLFVVHKPTNILKGIRAIGFDHEAVKTFKTHAAMQSLYYNSVDAVEQRIDKTMQLFTTKQMIQKTEMITLKAIP